MLSRTLEHLRRAVPIPSRRTAVLFCPALTRERYERERKPRSAFDRLLGRRPHDFVISQLLVFDWETYCDTVVTPANRRIQAIGQTTDTRVIPDASFRIFKEYLSNGAFDALFIVTHHPSGLGDELHFEFADGAYTLREVAAAIGKIKDSNRVSLVFFTCQSQQVQSGLYGKLPGLESVGYSNWRLSLHEGLKFLYHWIAALDGKTTLADAWHVATRNLAEETPD